MTNHFAFFCALCLLPLHTVYGQRYSDDSLRSTTAARIERTYGITVDPKQASFLELSDLESRLNACARIQKNFDIQFNYQKCSLLSLLDVESRLSACERIKRNHGIAFDYRSASLLEILDAESRIAATGRIKKAYNVDLDWRSHSLLALLERESDLRAGTQSIADSNISAPGTFKSSQGTLPSSPSYNRYYDYSYRPPVGDHYVAPHIRSDGTFVDGHMRTNADDSFWNNWSSSGNVNPYTGSTGTRLPKFGSSRSFGGSTYVKGHLRKDGTYVSGHRRR